VFARHLRGWSLCAALAAAATAAVAAGLWGQERSLPKRDESMLRECRAAMGRAVHYLESTQREDGSWRQDPAVTALVVVGILGSGQEGYGPRSVVVARALDYIRRFAKPDGSIYDRYYPCYSTSVALLALAEAGLPQDRELIRRGKRFLLDLQADESEGFTPESADYGGWGYEASPSREAARRADLSNTQMAIEAIKRLEALDRQERAGAKSPPGTRTDLAYDMALKFLQRCQNYRATNDQPWASDDGGFVYRPGESKAGGTPQGGLRSYGSMTYAGLKSMVYARLSRDDPRVLAAYRWACMHWSVTENPGLGQQGLYYYYMTMARALNVYGREVLVDARGVAHDWRSELVDQLLKTQNADGSWVNENGRWMERMPELVTAYVLIALRSATEHW